MPAVRRSRHVFGSIPFVWNTWPRTQVGAFTFGTMRRCHQGELWLQASVVIFSHQTYLGFVSQYQAETSKTTKTGPWQALELGSQVSKLPMFNEEIYNKVGWIECRIPNLLTVRSFRSSLLSWAFWVANFKMSLFVVTWQLVLVRRRCGSAKRISCVSELQVWKKLFQIGLPSHRIQISNYLCLLGVKHVFNMSLPRQLRKGSTSWGNCKLSSVEWGLEFLWHHGGLYVDADMISVETHFGCICWPQTDHLN